MDLRIINLSKTMVVAALAFTTLTINSCKDPLTDVDLVVNTEMFKTNISVQLKDRNSTSEIGIADATIKIVGGTDYSNPAGDVEFPDYVLDALGNKDFKVANGFVSMVLSPATVPTEAKPVRFTIVVSAPGYLTTYKSVAIYADGDYNEQIGMVKLDDLPQGVSSVTGTVNAGTAAAGTAADVSFEAAATNGKAEKAVVTIEQGTKFFDETGAQLTGTLDFSMVHFDNQNEKSILSTPGTGMAGGILFDSLGNKLEGGANPSALGLASIEIKKGTKKVKTFSKPVKLKMELNSNSIYEGEQLITAGNKLPVWSTDENTGVTKQETSRILYTNGNGKLEALIEMTHLTQYWLTPFVANGVFCSWSGLKFTNKDPNKFGANKVKLYNATTNVLIGESERSFLQIIGVRFANNYYLKAYRANQLVLTTETFAGCTDYNKSYDLELPAPPTYIPFNINVRGFCADKPGKRLATSLAIKIWDEETSEWLPYGDMKKGYFSGQLEKGKSHKIGAYFMGMWQQRLIDATGSEAKLDENWELPEFACKGF